MDRYLKNKAIINKGSRVDDQSVGGGSIA